MRKAIPVIIWLLLMLLLLPSMASAQTGGGYELSWFTIDGGGRESQANPYTLVGTVGQTEPGLLSGGIFTLSGGFWWDGATMLSKVFLPLLLRSP